MASIAARPSTPSRPRGVVRTFRLPTLALSALILGLVAGIGLFQVLQTSEVATAGYEIRALEVERDRLSAEIRLGEAEVAEMARGDRVRQEALERLGMVEPTHTVRVAVGAEAPSVIPLPARYVPQVEEPAPVVQPWWWDWLRRVPGFE
ncbi:MAG: hypothetical protein R3C39_11390 [Dehalococcoidia bacterium]